MIENLTNIKKKLETTVIGIPTDTVYGLAATKKNIMQIYKIKKRDSKKKLIKFITDYRQIGEVDDFTQEELHQITQKYWPGNNTLIFWQNNELKSYRIIKQKEVIALLNEIEEPLYTTSANISGENPILTKDEFEDEFPEIPLLEHNSEIKPSNIPSNIYIITKEKTEKIR